MFNKVIALILLSILIIAACDSDTTIDPIPNDPIYISNVTDGQSLSEPVSVRALSGTGLLFESVDFYVDGDSVWTASSTPFEYFWNVYQYTPMSSHELFAVGHTADSSFESETISVTITTESGFGFVSAYQPNSQQSFGVAAYQNYMFVAAGPSGLELIDISDIASPTYLTRYDSPGQAWKIVHAFPYLFLADRDAGVARSEITIEGALVLNSTFNTPGIANDVAVSGDYLYVADHDNLAIIDISNPDTLIPVSVFTIPAEVNYVAARNDTVFVTNVTGFYIIDCTDPEMPVEIDYVVTQGNAQAVAVQDTFAFVADGADGVKAFSINDPENITYLSSFMIGSSNISTVAVGEMALFAATLSGELFALDYEQEGGMQEVDSQIGTSSIHHIYYDAPYLFAAGSDNVRIFRFIQ